MGKGRSQVYQIPVNVAQFNAVRANQMLFQVCQDNELIEMGDRLVLQEIDDFNTLSGAIIACVVTYKQRGGSCGIEAGYCVLGLYKIGATLPPVITTKGQRYH